MELVNMSPFAAQQIVTNDGFGREILLVIVKACFSITGETAELLKEQPGIIGADSFRGEPDASSILAAGELALIKPAGEFVLTGNAYPRQRGDTEVIVSIRFGDCFKSVRVFGDRVWERTGMGYVPSPPEPVSKVPLVYERSFGGRDKDGAAYHPFNPAGCGFASRNSMADLAGTPVPNLIHPDHSLTAPSASALTTGFSWISPGWLPRRQYCGTYDENWTRNVMPHLPSDFNPRFFNAAPADQMLEGFIRGGEQVEVRNASSSGYLSFRVPQVNPVVSVCLGDDLIELQPACDTAIIDGESETLSLLWRGRVDLHHRTGEFYWTSVEESSRSAVNA